MLAGVCLLQFENSRPEEEGGKRTRRKVVAPAKFELLKLSFSRIRQS